MPVEYRPEPREGAMRHRQDLGLAGDWKMRWAYCLRCGRGRWTDTRPSRRSDYCSGCHTAALIERGKAALTKE